MVLCGECCVAAHAEDSMVRFHCLSVVLQPLLKKSTILQLLLRMDSEVLRGKQRVAALAEDNMCSSYF